MVKVRGSCFGNVPRLPTCNPSSWHDLNHQQPIGPGSKIAIAGWSLLGRHPSDVSYQFLYIVRLDLGTEGRHLSSALGDYFGQLRITLFPNFVGSKILRVHCLAGWVVSAAIG